MKSLSLDSMVSVEGGNDAVKGFCDGFKVSASIYILGAAANFWNPVGAAGTVALSTVAIGCWIAS
ncbi:hypothetical protein [uncultured Tenacibaculum sp.]|uniref:hypothetical protein n=1 Tax=uncultured Tenacibaculum sp. TaxID=174713 RepID=UPI002606A4AE|nr:hypothetical protein [uncultured Tenacibaculum sp.]